jgi:hypothetical protein
VSPGSLRFGRCCPAGKRVMPCNGTFITLAAGDQAIPAALCLKHQMRRVNSSCPLHIVVEDRPGREMSANGLARLQHVYGKARVVSMSTLVNNARTQGLGRRLIKDQFGAAASTSKFWLWAWPAEEKLAYLDTDVLLLRNVDEMLDVNLTAKRPFAAVPSCKSANIGWFNGGVLVFMPSLQTLHVLQALDRWTHYPWKGYIGKGDWVDMCAPFDGCTKPGCLAARSILGGRFVNNPERLDPFKACRQHFNGSFDPHGRIQLACEPRYTDQTILNRAFPRYVRMSKDFNMVRQARYDDACVLPMNTSTRRATCRYGFRRADGVAILHALGEPKPWAVRLSPERMAELKRADDDNTGVPKAQNTIQRERITALWQRRCGRFSFDVSVSRESSGGPQHIAHKRGEVSGGNRRMKGAKAEKARAHETGSWALE